ncbi:zinc finger protein 260-like isoform X2 [Cloeon dipterum]
MGSAECTVKNIVKTLQNFVEQLSSVDSIFEIASCSCLLRKFQNGPAVDEVINLSRKFASEIQCLLESYNSETEVDNVTNFDLNEVPEAECPDSNEGMHKYSNEIPAEIQNDNSSNANQYRTRRQRMLREAQTKKPILIETVMSPSKPEKDKSSSPGRKRKRNVRTEWPCTQCLRIFSTSVYLENHVKYAHEMSEQTLDRFSQLDKDSLNILCCCQCFHTYKDLETFTKHDCNLKAEELQELDLPIKEGEDRLVRHFDHLLELSYLICNQCWEEYRSLDRMVCHIAKCKPGPYLCEICSQSFENKKDLNYHKKKNHMDTLSFFCDFCDAKYKNRPSLQKHLVKKHEKNEDSFKCDECEEIFTMKILLTRHKEQQHNLIKKYLCQVCGEGLSNTQSLKIHVARHTDKEKKFSCGICGSKFNRKDKLVFHTRIHTGEKPYVCNQCSKRFIRKSKLDEHLRRHRGEKKHECEVCSKRFLVAHDLRAHQRRTHASKEADVGEEAASASVEKDDIFELEPKEPIEVESNVADIIIEVAQDNLQFSNAETVESLPLNAVDSLITNVPPQNILSTQNILQTPSPLPMHIMTPAANALQTPTFFQVPQTLQIQLPITVSGASLDLSQVGNQPIILTNFNTLSNLPF